MAKKPKTVAHDAPLVWTQKLEEILDLVFAGRLTRDKIAEKFSMTPRALYMWIAHPDFQAKLQAMRANLEATLLDRGVAYVAKESRIIGLSQMAEMARVQYEARELLQEKRQIGYDTEHDEPLYLINEAFNKDAHAAYRESLADIAKELGHRVTKTEVTGKDGEPLMTPVGMAIAAALMPRLGSPQARDVLATALLQEARIYADDPETHPR